MFMVKFFNPDVKKFEFLAGSKERIEWLKDYAAEIRDTMNVSVKIVNDENKIVAFYSRVI